jgi:hypothetical protein
VPFMLLSLLYEVALCLVNAHTRHTIQPIEHQA